MTRLPTKLAMIAGLLVLTSGEAVPLSFDERWQSMFKGTEVASDSISAKAEMARTEAKRERKSARKYSYRRHRTRSSRLAKYRGGKKYHYSRRRR